MRNFFNGFEKKSEDIGSQAALEALGPYRKALKRKSKESDKYYADHKKQMKKDEKSKRKAEEEIEKKDPRPDAVFEGSDPIGGKKIDKINEKQDAVADNTIAKHLARVEGDLCGVVTH